MKHTIRRLNKGEADLYRSLRLESLRESPEAFGTTLGEALKRDHESWRAQADASASGPDRATFVILGEEQPLGLAALYRDPERSGEGDLIQVWVSPGCRGGGVAEELMKTVFDWAASHGFTLIRAEVGQSNLRALRFYEKCGFVRDSSRDSLEDSLCILTKKLG